MMAFEEGGNPFKTRVDIDSPIAYYIQLKQEIDAALKRGVWQPGDQIPGEAQLCQMFGVSRTVVRRALGDLEYEGVVERIKGKGTFVAKSKIREGFAQKLTGFYQDMIDQGLIPFTKVLKREVVPASPKVAHRLAVTPGTPVFYLERLRFVEDEPVNLARNYIPYHLCPTLFGANLSTQSLYGFLESEYGLIITNARRTIEAVAATESEADLFEIDAGDALILIRSVAYLEDGTPVEYLRGLHRGDRSRFEIDLV